MNSTSNSSGMNWSLADFEFGATILGKGLFGTVYHGRFKRKRSNSQEQNVAIKVMDRISMMKRQEYIDMVMNERRILASLGSLRHVVKLYLSFVDTHNLIMVMELCSCDLAAVVQCGNSDTHNRTHDPLYLEFASVQVLTAQLVMALEEIHSRCIVHCDLKPQNILLTNSGLLKLTDFATARIITSFNSIDTEKIHAMNPSNHFMGTADYLPPEILLGGSNQNPNVAQDLWALGCIIYFMFLGQSPFHTDSDFLTFEKINNYAMNLETWPISPLIPTAAVDLITQLLSRVPSQRTIIDKPHDEKMQTANMVEKRYEGIRAHSFMEGINWDNLVVENTVELPALLSERLSRCSSFHKDDKMIDGSSLPFDFFN